MTRGRQVGVIRLNGSITYSSDFNPISELSRDDGDLTIAFLVGNGARYTEKATDLWYRGTVPSGKWLPRHSPTSPAQVAYSPDEAASPLGCLQQYQICNIDENHCGPLKGFVDYQIQSASIFNVSEETEKASEDTGLVENNPLGQRFQWFTMIMSYGTVITLSNSLSQLGPYSLSSQSLMRDGLIGSLAENQWQLDVERWWATGLASLQAGMVEVAVGSTEVALQPYTIHAPNSYIQDHFCNGQVGTVCFGSLDFIVLTKSLCVTENINYKVYIIQPLWDLLHLCRRYYYRHDILFAGACSELSLSSKEDCRICSSGVGDNGELATPASGISRHQLRHMDRSLRCHSHDRI